MSTQGPDDQSASTDDAAPGGRERSKRSADQSRPLSIGWIGLGNMGRPMAVNVAGAGYRPVCFDAAGTAERLPDGAAAADSVAEVSGLCDVILVSVPDGAASMSVARQISAATDRRTSVVVDLSTVGPVAAAEIAEVLGTAGVTYCDGPVSGGAAGARAATISLMFAGPAEVFARLSPLLQSFTGNVFNIGERVGQGQTMKLVNNFLSATALAATSEAFAMGQSFGLPLATMIDVVNVSSGRNTATSDKFPHRVLTGTFDAGFATAHMTKDVALYLAAVQANGGPDGVGSAVASIWLAANTELPGSDFSEIWRHVARL